MSLITQTFPVIEALVARHAEDAAFYWSQLDGAIRSPTLRLDRLHHFNGLLDAHLDGLVVAGSQGWQPAMAALTRWKKPGEAFVCTWLAAQGTGRQRLDEVLEVAKVSPQNVLRGMISALAWLPPGCAAPVIGQWGHATMVPVAQVAALRAAALIGPEAVAALGSPLPDFLVCADSHVRAAACRALAGGHHGATVAALRDALADADVAVRAEAAIALGKGQDAARALPVLLRCVIDQAHTCAAATGWHRMQAARRLDRWVRELASLTPFGMADTGAMLAILPPRTALTFALVHGDPSHLGFVARLAGEPEVSRYAGWVWQSLTGIDLAEAGLALPEPPPSALARDELITEARLDADNGLPQPDSAALSGHPASQSPVASHAGPVLLGRSLDRQHALDVLQGGPQALRLLAARTLGVTVRGPVHPQLAALGRMRAESAEGNR